MISLPEQVACAARELAMRQRVYPKWVNDGRMKADKAEQETKAMAAILATLQKAAMMREVSDEILAEAERLRPATILPAATAESKEGTPPSPALPAQPFPAPPVNGQAVKATPADPEASEASAPTEQAQEFIF